MEETLYDKMFIAIGKTVPNAQVWQIELIAKTCERVALQDKIVMLKIINQNLELHVEHIKILSDNEPIRYSGKVEGIRLAIESNQKEINELEKQLEL